VPLDLLEDSKEVEESFDCRESSEEDRGLKGRWAVAGGARLLCRLGEYDLFNGGGGEPEGVECDERRSSHISSRFS